MDNLDDWRYPEGPAIVKSFDFPTGTYDGVGLAGWAPISNVQIIVEIRDLKRKLENAEMKLAELEAIRIKEFKENDVYEVKKRIERLESKVEWITSNLVSNRIIKFLFERF